MLLPSAPLSSLKYADPNPMGKGVRAYDPELLIRHREKVKNIGVVLRSEAVFWRELKYCTSTWLTISRMLVQVAYLAAVPGVYTPAVYLGFILLMEGSAQLQGF